MKSLSGRTSTACSPPIPRLVAEARTIPEISYREATELAYFGAKVLHPKTLRAVAEQGIPVWIRNSFHPEKIGTKITPKGRTNGGGVKALTAIKDVTLISLGGPGIVGAADVVGRTFSTTSEVHATVLLISQSSSQNDICFIVSSADAKRTVEALRKEFAQDIAHEKVEHITVDPNIAIVAVVGENMRGTPGVAGRVFIALGQENVNIIAIAQGSSESNISFVVVAAGHEAGAHCHAPRIRAGIRLRSARPARGGFLTMAERALPLAEKPAEKAVQRCILPGCGSELRHSRAYLRLPRLRRPA